MPFRASAVALGSAVSVLLVRVEMFVQIGVPVARIRPRGNESIQQMLKRFKRLCQREGLTRDMKRHSYYEKPSERKRRQMRKSIRKLQKDQELAEANKP